MYALSGYIKIKEIITRLLTALYRKAFILSPVYRVFFSDFRFFRKGNFCPVCLKIYGSDDELQSPMICCDICDRWIHTGMLDLKFYSRYTQNDLFHIKSVQDIGFCKIFCWNFFANILTETIVLLRCIKKYNKH